jgi:NADP-dependent 3-hydroxy acid dehydrogenase YdfG
MKLNGKVAVITGASGGIGEATAMALAAEGAIVVLAARRINRLQAVKVAIEEAGGQAMINQVDVTSASQLKCLADNVIKAYGRIDIMVNNAGIMPLSFVKNLQVEEWERMIDVNIKSVMYGVAAVLPQMRKQGNGHIINISSTAGRRVFPGGAVYCATKFAVNAFSEGIRLELSHQEHIRVTVIEPGVTATELSQSITDSEFLENRGKRAQIVPLQASDVAAAVVYAASQPMHVNVNEILVMPTEQNF